MKKIDLHCHTTISDGTSSPVQLIQEALEREIWFLCITDHDATSDALLFALNKAWIKSVPSVEISAQNSHDEGKSLHLTYYSRASWQQIEAITHHTRSTKKQLILLQLHHLQKLWFFVDIEEFYEQLALTGRQEGGISKYDIARYIALKGQNLVLLESIWCTASEDLHTQFYNLCLKRKWTLYDTYAVEVDEYEPEVETLWAIATSRNAILSIAHPNFTFSREGIAWFLEIFPLYYSLWVNAIEVNTRATKKWVEAIILLKSLYPNIQLTFGSDCHRVGLPDEKHGDLGFFNPHIPEAIVRWEFEKFCEKLGIPSK